jgi:hypothetical protein
MNLSNGPPSKSNDGRSGSRLRGIWFPPMLVRWGLPSENATAVARKALGTLQRDHVFSCRIKPDNHT